MFKDYEDNKDYKEVRMIGVQSNYMKAMVELVYNGETGIKLSQCEEFVNILKQYRVSSNESLSEDKEDKASKTKHGEQNEDKHDTMENVIPKQKNEKMSSRKLSCK